MMTYNTTSHLFILNALDDKTILWSFEMLDDYAARDVFMERYKFSDRISIEITFLLCQLFAVVI